MNKEGINKDKPLCFKLRGVPEFIFQKSRQSGITRGLFGRSRLSYQVSPTEIEIIDTDNPEFIFNAELDKNKSNEFLLRVVVKTKRVNEVGVFEKHPDLYANDLLIRAVSFFEELGCKIKIWELNWVEGREMDENLTMFVNSLGKGGLKQSDEVIEKAIFTTWSGKMAWKMGFRQIKKNGDKLVTVDPATGSLQIYLKRTFYPKFIKETQG